jgi:hypothetical protein
VTFLFFFSLFLLSISVSVTFSSSAVLASFSSSITSSSFVFSLDRSIEYQKNSDFFDQTCDFLLFEKLSKIFFQIKNNLCFTDDIVT